MSASSHILFMRQLGIVRPEELPAVTMIGCGGIGSCVVIKLAKMGVKKFILYDPDEVQLHNVSNQMFPREGSLNRDKVDVVAEEIHRYSPLALVEVVKHKAKFEDVGEIEGVPISGLDSLAARKAVWKVIKEKEPTLYIDARMGGEAGIVYAVDPNKGTDVRLYEKSLDQDPYPLPCTAQAIAYNISGIEMIVGSIIRRSSTNMSFERRYMVDTLNLKLFSLP